MKTNDRRERRRSLRTTRERPNIAQIERETTKLLKHAAYPLLFDPQTAGGLLSTVPADRADECVAELRSLGYEAAAAIGRVTEVLPDDDGACALTLVDVELE